MRKGVMLLLVLVFMSVMIVMSSIGVLAENHTDSGEEERNTGLEGLDKGYACLRGEIDEKSSLSLDEAIFSVLALGSNSKAVDKIEDEKESNRDCWPKGNCNIGETARVLLAYDRMGRSTRGIEEWLSSQNGTATDLTWFLEIDIQSHEASECRVKHDGTEKSVTIKDDLTLQWKSGGASSCLSIDSQGGSYWLSIKENCLDKEFEISCEDDFITTLLYRKGLTGTLFVSSETHSSAGLGSTEEKVSSQCFGAGGTGSCDYESTLWGVLALHEVGENVEAFLPYLLALSGNNGEHFPSAFLYILTNSQDQFAEIVQKQKQNKYWEIAGSSGNRFYDTSIGMLGLGGTGAAELENAKSYLLSIQQDTGCWDNDNVKSTGFLLYSGWPRAAASDSGGGTGSGLCEPANGFCEARMACLESQGLVQNEFECLDFAEVCCSVDVREQSCLEKSGILCSSSQRCEGSSVSSLEGTCCLTACINIQVTENICEQNGGSCKTSCFSDEEDTGESCSISGDRCCVEKTDPKGISIWVWIILIILIVLVALSIWKRNKIKLWMHKRRGDVKSSPVTRGHPRGPPRPGMGRPMRGFAP
ncbi:hypothetical protein CMI45_03420, partial [Candidatus Pacearchaeota archaeon]|nr:hypothetical protein [Candidatus Pacearchaeota archaeon]